MKLTKSEIKGINNIINWLNQKSIAKKINEVIDAKEVARRIREDLKSLKVTGKARVIRYKRSDDFISFDLRDKNYTDNELENIRKALILKHICNGVDIA
jgi:hypothetical protein